jgi:hypothetical protein
MDWGVRVNYSHHTAINNKFVRLEDRSASLMVAQARQTVSQHFFDFSHSAASDAKEREFALQSVK